jgi:hypothetical protein
MPAALLPPLVQIRKRPSEPSWSKVESNWTEPETVDIDVQDFVRTFHTRSNKSKRRPARLARPLAEPSGASE